MNFLAILKLLESLYKELCNEAGVKFISNEKNFHIKQYNCSGEYDSNMKLDDERWAKLTLLMPHSLIREFPFLPWDEWALRVRKLSCYDRHDFLTLKFSNRPLHSEYDLLHRRGGKPCWKKESYYKPISFIIANPDMPWNFKILFQRHDITLDDFRKMPREFQHLLKDRIPNTALLNMGIKPCITLTTPGDIMNFPNIRWNFKDLSHFMDFEFMISTLDKYPWDIKKSHSFRKHLERYRSKKQIYEFHNFLVMDIRKIIMDYI